MRTQAIQEQKFIEEQILLANIQRMEDLPAEDHHSTDHTDDHTTDHQPTATQPAQSQLEAPEQSTVPAPADEDEAPTTDPPGTDSQSHSGVADSNHQPPKIEPQLSQDGKYVILDGQTADDTTDQSPSSPGSHDLNEPITENQDDVKNNVEESESEA